MKVAILGATGSIGGSALALAEAFPEYIEITALTCGRQVERLAGYVTKFRPGLVAVGGEAERDRLRGLLKDLGSPAPEILCGEAGQVAAAVESGAETVLSAIVGGAAMAPTFAAVGRGLRVALANKESLVMGGELVMPLARQTGAEIIPVDSEHSAIFQALGGQLNSQGLRRIILTASGGPFRGFTGKQLESVSREQALAHPRWSMGAKISCDSATMMNKGLEIIEAHHLFGLDYDRLDVLVHPQSIVHSIVEYLDGSQVAQLGPTDMRLPIAYAFSYPERWPLAEADRPGLAGLGPLDLAEVKFQGYTGHLTFERPDYETFPALNLARAAGRQGGMAPAVLTGANEAAVNMFLEGKIEFSAIVRIVEKVLEGSPVRPVEDIVGAIEAEREARRLAERFAGEMYKTS
ncbi:1-deoxy-D-xylulose-5-phosphate reductoisomerase [Deltaproteobacteria bacterium Smac51]|nr:1-deoxy-D-xylulose-5-phosphate reductoisomerase [Deltaproteobacteria bacterium Smac51]